jgi:hypothetical protein
MSYILISKPYLIHVYQNYIILYYIILYYIILYYIIYIPAAREVVKVLWREVDVRPQVELAQSDAQLGWVYNIISYDVIVSSGTHYVISYHVI